MSQPGDRRRLLSRLRETEAPRVVERLSPTGKGAPSADVDLRLSADASFSLEIVGDVVQLVVWAPNGEHRPLSWAEAWELIATLSEGPKPLASSRPSSNRSDRLSLIQEMAQAGILVAASSPG
jgi:hypothetical protein